ncbi:MAG: flavin reductase family protein [Candidatus Lokiarchaeota archaeon]|nr:flavin reductase family protein [Candidatus Lokiarchaeota archaeon]
MTFSKIISMNNKIHIEPRYYALCFIPVPVYLISTIDNSGIFNIAPYGMIMPVSYNPLIISVGSAKNRDTYRNIVDNNEFVLNVPSIDLLRKVNRTADPVPPEIDEFEHANLTPIDSKIVTPPRIKECSTHMECQSIWIKEVSDKSKNRVIITAKVVALSINKDLFQKDLCKQKGLLAPLYYEKHSYFTIGAYIGNRRMR